MFFAAEGGHARINYSTMQLMLNYSTSCRARATPVKDVRQETAGSHGFQVNYGYHIKKPFPSANSGVRKW
jgi:hypothetical protein